MQLAQHNPMIEQLARTESLLRLKLTPTEYDAYLKERALVPSTPALDPARLAGREDECWNFDGAGGVTVLAGPAPYAAPQAERVTIRLEAADAAGVLDQVRAIDGVRVISVDVEGADRS